MAYRLGSMIGRSGRRQPSGWTSVAKTASLLLAAALLAPACASSAGDAKEEAADEASSQSFSLTTIGLVGSIAYGETSPVTRYTRHPRYLAYELSGSEGDEVDVWVRSHDGDPVTWLLDASFRTIAKNDDASWNDTDSHLHATLPASPSAKHYIVVRDYWRDPMTFTVEVAGTSPDPEPEVERCGGFAGIACEDPDDECVDDPTDSCDPAHGGADCGGICQPKSEPPPPPPPPADCRSNGCESGKWCTFCWGSYACIPEGAVC